jgi:hypothetical protein
MSRLIIVLTILSWPVVTEAADTLETWDAGAGNFEMYSGFEGVGAETLDQGLSSSLLVGWGVADRFSSYLGTSIATDGYFSSAETELDLGAFGTLYNSDHLDFDLGLNMTVSGPGMEQAAFVPAFELNLDHSPDLATYGFYTRGAAVINGGDPGDEELRRHVDWNFSFGSYYTLSPRQQVLLEYDITIHDEPEPGIPDIPRGAVALGYNALLNEDLELISEFRLDVPQGDEDYQVGFMLGVIATLSGN